MHVWLLLGTWRGDTYAQGLALLQAINFFTRDTKYLFEGMYYGPLTLFSGLFLIACNITSCLVLGPTALIATVCFLLILPLEVTSFFFGGGRGEDQP